MTFSLDEVAWVYGSDAETNARVTSVTLSVENTLDEATDGYTFQVFVYDPEDLDYVLSLNQVGDPDDYVSIPDIASGGELTKEYTFSGKLFSNLDNTKTVDVDIFDNELNLITTETLTFNIE